MIAADRPARRQRKVLALDRFGSIRPIGRRELDSSFDPGDLVVANDAATLPASMTGLHRKTGDPVEVRLAAFIPGADPTRFLAVVFGAGDHRTLTEDRPLPPHLSAGDRFDLGPLTAVVERVGDHPRLVLVAFDGAWPAVLAGMTRHGRPIQYAHVPDPLEVWDVWTAIAARPFAFEAPSAGFFVDWRTVAGWQTRDVGFATVTHSAGISSTGDPELDARLPFDEVYAIPDATAMAIGETRKAGGRVIAVGTTVVRALEAAATNGGVIAGEGVATGRIGRDTPLRVVDTILTGVHEPGDSHFELLGAFAEDSVLRELHQTAAALDYRTHEFGDALLIERTTSRKPIESARGVSRGIGDRVA